MARTDPTPDPTSLEERIAHLERQVEDLSDIVARQDRDIALLTRRIQMVMEREAEREADGSSAVHLGDQKPPHW